MHYSFEEKVLISHLPSSPLIHQITLGAGVITRVQIVFRSGCDGLVRCKLYSQSKQILPTNPDGQYALDGDTVDAVLHHDLAVEGNDIFFVGWNIGTKLSHTLTLLIDVQGPDEPHLSRSLEYLASAINNLITMMRSWY